MVVLWLLSLHFQLFLVGLGDILDLTAHSFHNLALRSCHSVETFLVVRGKFDILKLSELTECKVRLGKGLLEVLGDDLELVPLIAEIFAQLFLYVLQLDQAVLQRPLSLVLGCLEVSIRVYLLLMFPRLS